MRALPAAAMPPSAQMQPCAISKTPKPPPMSRSGATFEQVPGYPTWFAARWEGSRSFDEPRRWACCIEEWDREHHYAKAFRARVEMQEGLQ